MKFSHPLLRPVWLLLVGSLLMACGYSTVTPAPTTTLVPPSPTTTQPTASFVPTTPTVMPPNPTLPPQPSASRPRPALPPTQVASGPGGTTYLHSAVNENVFGTGHDQYYLYEPADPTPKTAPLIILMHGYGGLTPDNYRPWIDHLVKRGNLVIYPVYQARADEYGLGFTEYSANAIKAAIEQLNNGKIKPELDNVSFFGYSAGGVLAANLASQSEALGLPAPKAIFFMTPGGAVGYGLTTGSIKIEVPGLKFVEADELGKISPNTKILIVTADEDQTVGEIAARFIWQSLAQIPPTNKDFITLHSDAHGRPSLLADHGIANRFVPDALNYFGMWKLFDALQSCSLSNKDCDTAFGNTPAQRYMGKWSDGTPVKELTVLKNP